MNADDGSSPPSARSSSSSGTCRWTSARCGRSRTSSGPRRRSAGTWRPRSSRRRPAVVDRVHGPVGAVGLGGDGGRPTSPRPSGSAGPTATGVLKHARAAGLGRPPAAPDDGRRVLLRLTPDGRGHDRANCSRGSTRPRPRLAAGLSPGEQDGSPRCSGRLQRSARRADLGGPDPDGHPLGAVHEVRADPLDRARRARSTRSGGGARRTGSASRAARGARPGRSADRRGRT